jgi:hypothetical protein
MKIEIPLDEIRQAIREEIERLVKNLPLPVQQPTQPKLAYSIAELSEMVSLSQPFLRLEIRAGRLPAKRFGARVLVLASDWEKYAVSRADWT